MSIIHPSWEWLDVPDHRKSVKLTLAMKPAQYGIPLNPSQELNLSQGLCPWLRGSAPGSGVVMTFVLNPAWSYQIPALQNKLTEFDGAHLPYADITVRHAVYNKDIVSQGILHYKTYTTVLAGETHLMVTEGRENIRCPSSCSTDRVWTHWNTWKFRQEGGCLQRLRAWLSFDTRKSGFRIKFKILGLSGAVFWTLHFYNSQVQGVVNPEFVQGD